MSEILDKAKYLIEEVYKEDYYEILAEYLADGYVYMTPTTIGLAKRTGNDLFVYLLIGDMSNIKTMLTTLDFIPENVTCMRRGIFKTYTYSNFFNKLPNKIK